MLAALVRIRHVHQNLWLPEAWSTRLHGGEGTWAPMAEACLGYSAISAMLDAYLDPTAFAALPVVPSDFKAHAKEAKLRSNVHGVLKEIDAGALAAIRSLASYQSDMVAPVVGKPIALTIDAVTACGNVNLVNSSLAHCFCLTIITISSYMLITTADIKGAELASACYRFEQYGKCMQHVFLVNEY